MRKRRLREVPAYFTVEASMIIPMVVALFAILIYLSFFLYDRCVFAQDSYILCFRASIVKESEDRAALADSLKSRQFGTKYFGLDQLSLSFSEQGGKVSAKGEGRLSPAVFSSYFLMPEQTFCFTSQTQARIYDIPNHVRKYRRIRYLATKAGEFLEQWQ